MGLTAGTGEIKQRYSRKGNRVHNNMVNSSFSCCWFWGPFWWTIQHSLTLLRSQPRLRQSWLIPNWKGFQHKHSWKSYRAVGLKMINIARPQSFWAGRQFCWKHFGCFGNSLTFRSVWHRWTCTSIHENHYNMQILMNSGQNIFLLLLYPRLRKLC